MSDDDFGLHHATDRLNALAAMLLEAGRSTPVGTLVGPLSRLTGGLKPTASLGMGIAVGSAAVLAISAILKARVGRQEGTAAATPAAGGGGARADASAASAGMAEAGSSAGPAAQGEVPAVGAAAAPPAAAASSPAEPRTKRAPRRKSTRKPAGAAR